MFKYAKYTHFTDTVQYSTCTHNKHTVNWCNSEICLFFSVKCHLRCRCLHYGSSLISNRILLDNYFSAWCDKKMLPVVIIMIYIIIMITNGQSNLTSLPHIDGSVVFANVHAIRYTLISVLTIPKLFRVYRPPDMCQHVCHQNWPFAFGNLDPHLIHGSLCPLESTHQMASRSV